MILHINGKLAGYPRVKHLYPTTSFSARPNEQEMRDLGHYVEPTPRPPGDVVTQGQPEQRDGIWHQTWDVREFNAEERAERLEQEQAATRQRLTDVIQQHLDAVAQTRNYDNMLSLCTYATSSHATFAAEGQAGVEWRDSVWAMGYQLLDEALASEREIPSESELIALLPEMQWPAEAATA